MNTTVFIMLISLMLLLLCGGRDTVSARNCTAVEIRDEFLKVKECIESNILLPDSCQYRENILQCTETFKTNMIPCSKINGKTLNNLVPAASAVLEHMCNNKEQQEVYCTSDFNADPCLDNFMESIASKPICESTKVTEQCLMLAFKECRKSNEFLTPIFRIIEKDLCGRSNGVSTLNFSLNTLILSLMGLIALFTKLY